jgi:hypothetical protein
MAHFQIFGRRSEVSDLARRAAASAEHLPSAAFRNVALCRPSMPERRFDIGRRIGAGHAGWAFRAEGNLGCRREYIGGPCERLSKLERVGTWVTVAG